MRLKPGAKILLALVVLFLVGFAAKKLGWLDPVMNVVAPERKPQGTISADDFGETNQGDSTAADDKPADKPADKPVDNSGGKLSRPIRVGIVLWGGYAGGMMANGGMKANKNCAFYRDHGIQVELVQIDDFPASRDAFRAGGDNGGLDILWSTVDAYAQEYDSLKSLDPKCILQYDWSRGGDAIAVGPGIKQASDLKGKTVSVAEFTPSHFFLLYVLSQAGLSANDIKLLPTASAIEAAQVFKAGKADACVSWSPDVYLAARDRQGAKILASTREATSLIADIFVARGDFIDRYPEETTAFVKGWLKGVEMVGDDPDTAAKVVASSFAIITEDDAVGMLADVHLPGAAENRKFFELEGDTLIGYADLFSRASNIWRKIGALQNIARPDITVDTRFLEAATASWDDGSAPAEAVVEVYPEKPATEKQEAKAPIVTKRLTIYFATGSAELDPNAKMVLEQAAELAETFGSAYIRVSGNTDNVGGREMNLKLSKQRANAVVNFLVNKYGFPRSKFIVEGHGPDKPVAKNDTEEGRAKNRRTDFEVIAQ
jgi:NitT/TauT family transport system substrate-binding protein